MGDSNNSIDGNTCNTENERPWFNNLKTLFCSWSFLPSGSQKSGTRFNAISRLLLYITVLLILMKFEKWYMFFLAGLTLLIILYAGCVKNNNAEHFFSMVNHEASTNPTRENFAFLYEDISS